MTESTHYSPKQREELPFSSKTTCLPPCSHTTFAAHRSIYNLLKSSKSGPHHYRIYLRSGHSDPHLFTIDLEAIMQLGANVIMCGDYNAHHLQWKCNNNNARGLQLLNFAIKTDLDIIAPNSHTRYGHNSTSTIDLAVIKNFLFPYQISSIAELSSDHNPVELTFNFDYLIP
ncbi:hypothetical protein CDAR_103341, partial [Caerostris darwini]